MNTLGTRLGHECRQQASLGKREHALAMCRPTVRTSRATPVGQTQAGRARRRPPPTVPGRARKTEERACCQPGEEIDRDRLAKQLCLSDDDTPARCERLGDSSCPGGGAREIVHWHSFRLHHHPWSVEEVRLRSSDIQELPIEQQRDVLQGGGAEGSLAECGYRDHTVAEDQDSVIGQRVELARFQRGQEARQRFPIPLPWDEGQSSRADGSMNDLPSRSTALR